MTKIGHFGAERLRRQNSGLSSVRETLAHLLQILSATFAYFIAVVSPGPERRFENKLHEQPSILDYGAGCDTNVLRWTDADIAAGPKVLTTANGWFSWR